MTEVDFFEAILANPDDRSLPLVYADWLEERGDPRSEFLRLQAELAGRNANLRGERNASRSYGNYGSENSNMPVPFPAARSVHL
jgi:uncharacterized protein (TIGR02996 family)